MGFIEKMRRMREEEAQREARERARYSAQREESSRREVQAAADEERRKALRARALEQSAVLGVTTQAFPGSLGWAPHGGHISINVGSSVKDLGETWTGSGTTVAEHKDRYIDIQGQEDGSVLIGGRRLNPSDASDPGKVEKALENAHNHPRVETHRMGTDRITR